MNESKFSPMPWTTYQLSSKSSGIEGQDTTTIVPFATNADAALIVRAVNSHADLVAALQAIVAEIDGPDRPYSTDSYLPRKFVEQARAALARAKG